MAARDDAKRKAGRLRRKARMQQKAKEWIKNYLGENPCVDCGCADIRVLEFDHREPKNKKFNISKRVCGGVALDTLATEVAKCDVRCANCHRIRTKEERHFGPNDKKSGGLVGGLPKKVEIFHKRMGLLSD